MAEEIRHIVRIAGKDLDGFKKIARALSGIKGVDYNLARAITKIAIKQLKIEEGTQIGMLTEKQTEEIEKIVLDPTKHGIPIWMLNRRNDYETGEDKHLTSHDLDFTHKGDFDRAKKSRSYKGVRRQMNLTVRGQRTRTSGRIGQTVGVQRKKTTKGSGK